MFLEISQRFSEALEMDDLAFPQETDGIADFRILDHAQDVVVRGAGLLFGREILREIGNRVALGLELAGIEGDAACSLGPYARGVVNIVGAESLLLQLLGGKPLGELVNDGGYYLQMGQLAVVWSM